MNKKIGIILGAMFFMCSSAMAVQEGQVQTSAQNLPEGWEGIQDIARPNKEIFQQNAEKRLQSIDAHIRELKNKIEGSQKKDQYNQTIEKIQDRRDDLEQRFETFKGQEEGTFEYSQSELPGQLKETENSVQDAATKIISEKQAYEWRIESNIHRLEAAIDAAKANREAQKDTDQDTVDQQIKRLEESKDRLQQKLDDLKQRSAENWNEIQDEIDAELEPVQQVL